MDYNDGVVGWPATVTPASNPHPQITVLDGTSTPPELTEDGERGVYTCYSGTGG